MAVVGLPPAFIPPVVAVPAANAIVPLVAGAAATGVSLPVLPLVGAVVVGAAVAGLAALAVGAFVSQDWGYLNKRGATGQPNWQGPTQGNVYPNSVVFGQGNGSGYMQPVVTNAELWSDLRATPVPDNAVVSTWWEYTEPEVLQSFGWTFHYSWMEPSGQVRYECIKAGIFNSCAIGGEQPGEEPKMQISGWQRVGASELEPEVAPIIEPSVIPFPQPEPAPAPQPQPQPEPLPLPLPLPEIAPVQPATAPAETGDRPRAVPRVAPATARPLPLNTPQPQGSPMQADGTQAPAPQLPPAKTPTDAHIVNGVPIRSPGPAPTPEGIAKEVGRIEEKLASLMDPKRAPDGDNTDRLGLLFQLAQQIFEFLTSVTASGEYTLSSPCVLDENDQRIVQSVQYGGAMGPIGLVSNKVDALAELIQVHKDLKQPICRQTPAVGQPVTVNFVQTD